jgi:hypothetical protein
VIGSAGLASLFSHTAFWLLVCGGLLSDGLSRRTAAIFAVVWAAGLVLLPYAPYGAALFSPFVVVLDIALDVLTAKNPCE